MKGIILTMLAIVFSHAALSQGCIPFRNLVGFGQFAKPEYDPVSGQPTKWFVNVTQRYYNSYQTYSGTTAVAEQDWQKKTTSLYMINFGITRVLNNGWAISLDLPISSASRNAWRPEHNTSDSSLQKTHSFGINDMRITVYKWLWDISQANRGNIQVGLGMKLPTGDYRYSDYFYTNDSTTVLAPVNPTIQLGDGGTGITAELNAFYTLSRSVTLYGNLFYLFNPRDVNGVSMTYGRTATDLQKRATSDIFSVPDSYTARVGGNVTVHDFTFWAGLRMEGVPVNDVFGESNGQRRAGKVISVDPGFNYKFKTVTLYTFVPFPIFRETKQTVPDQRLTEYTGTYVPSPGGFANWQLFLGIMIKI